jgi:hypothetical protein
VNITYETQKQAVREREAEKVNGNIFKAGSEKILESTEQKRGDLGNVQIACMG